MFPFLSRLGVLRHNDIFSLFYRQYLLDWCIWVLTCSFYVRIGTNDNNIGATESMMMKTNSKIHDSGTNAIMRYGISIYLVPCVKDSRSICVIVVLYYIQMFARWIMKCAKYFVLRRNLTNNCNNIITTTYNIIFLVLYMLVS